MRIIGRLLRYLLNINTIWALMILTAFGLCAAQHYLPTWTPLPGAALPAGPHAVTIRVRPASAPDEPRERCFTIERVGPALALRPDDRQPRSEAPWLVAADPRGDDFLLTWDCRLHGQYEVLVDGQPVAAGRLVTFQSLTDAAFGNATKAFNIALGLVAAMVLFLGLMKVGEDAGIVRLVARALYPAVRFLFPDVPKDHPANGAILMNVTTTVLGLGNAATPFGLKAMQELQRLNPHPDIASDSQVMLLGYNTAGFALLPTTLLALRKSANCSDPFEIIGTCMLAGAVSTLTAIIMVKLLGRLPVFSLRAALAEAARERAAAAPPAGQEGG